MAITLDPADRAIGLVWRKDALAPAPATHVLIVGVGRFDAPGLAPLKSTTASARALAAWFLDGATGRAEGFHHPARPLGSLAVVLSEHAAGLQSEVEAGPVPRATFDNVKAALRAWVARAGTNDGSAGILAVFSHGQAERRRTAILFEDAGMDPEDIHAGMTEAEQLINALSTRAPRDKMLILDCCRMAATLNLPHQGDIGRPLIGEVASQSHHRPQVMMATQYDGFSYGGSDGRPTLLGSALLDGLRGCAADINDHWQVNSRRLGEITQRIVGLWRDESEPLQVPDTQDNRAFVVTQAPERDALTLFVNMAEGHDIRQARIALFQGAATIHDSSGHGDPEPFARITAPAGQPLRLVASQADGALIGEDAWRAFPPVAFRELPAAPRTAPMVTTDRAKGIAGTGRADVRLESGQGAAAPAIVTFDRAEEPGMLTESAAPGIAMVPGTSLGRDADLPGGNWVMNLRRPGVPPVTRYLRINPGDLVRVTMPSDRSPHEWLQNAVAAGILAADTPPAAGPPTPPPTLRGETDGGPEALVDAVAGDARFTLFRVRDEQPTRFQTGSHTDADKPVWIVGTGTGADGRLWRERVFLPVQGGFAEYGETADGPRGPWQVELLADAAPPRRGTHLAACAVSRHWRPMLAFLGRRAFPEAGAALRALGPYPVQNAVLGKLTNPLAAICGALVAVATRQTGSLGIPDDWLENLCDWFPTLPDGAVILARHRLMQGLGADALLETALSRGTPVTSLAVDWLSEAMAMTGHPRAAEARETAMACDPTRTFTVLHLAPVAP